MFIRKELGLICLQRTKARVDVGERQALGFRSLGEICYANGMIVLIYSSTR